jgi:hypothetical protein
MKQALKHTANLPATFSGDNGALPLAELLQALARSMANGILLVASRGRRFEVRLAGGRLAHAPGASALAALIADDSAAWSFRATAGAPEGSLEAAVDEALLAAAFAMV